MNSDIAISAKGLGKSYLIKHHSDLRTTTLRESILGSTSRLLQGKRKVVETSETFWALQDVSFDIKQGQILGVIGSNGAGKSTLLKILSRITEPTKGFAEIRGKVGSLLEVGTGFHPELTGRENIYLNGTLLGMRKREIDGLFSEIVAFAEVERFLDTPVKRYSSGMYVRLAFAVAAHMSPEILIVDEVLAVGDAAFQKKSLGRMEKVAKSGRTVLFVSHNMASISALCDRCIILDHGRVTYEGPSGEAVLKYHGQSSKQSSHVVYQPDQNMADEYVRLVQASLEDEHDRPAVLFETRRPLKIRLTYEILTSDSVQCVPNCHFFAADGRQAFIAYQPDIKPLARGIYESICTVPENLTNDGVFSVGLAITTYREERMLSFVFDQGALTFNVVDPMIDEFRSYGYFGPIPGAVRPVLNWSFRKVESPSKPS